VGHEIDFTIADFVADLRAATPSAAAEIVTQNYVASREFVEQASQRLVWLMRQAMEERETQAGQLIRRLNRLHPRRQMEAGAQRLDETIDRLSRAGADAIRDYNQSLAVAVHRLQGVRPSHALAMKRAKLGSLTRSLAGEIRTAHEDRVHRLDRAVSRLKLLSPLSVLERGYSITLDSQTGQVLREAAGLESGRRLLTKFHRGEVGSVVTRVSAESP
jgi:exodeoxyribonuclease VII large subunit